MRPVDSIDPVLMLLLHQLLLPKQRLLRHSHGPKIPSRAAPRNPLSNIFLIYKIAVQTQLQFQRQVNRGDGALRHILSVHDDDVIPEDVEVI
jgi:hypothetical protein